MTRGHYTRALYPNFTRLIWVFMIRWVRIEDVRCFKHLFMIHTNQCSGEVIVDVANSNL